mmetsp:Transcript_17452/g.25059  ORF Transcript_17452/g.25059 Transcript_17452/m.25059 type:complete len:203 (-) Transcript_17452:959-1567(-)
MRSSIKYFTNHSALAIIHSDIFARSSSLPSSMTSSWYLPSNNTIVLSFDEVRSYKSLVASGEVISSSSPWKAMYGVSTFSNCLDVSMQNFNICQAVVVTILSSYPNAWYGWILWKYVLWLNLSTSNEAILLYGIVAANRGANLRSNGLCPSDTFTMGARRIIPETFLLLSAQFSASPPPMDCPATKIFLPGCLALTLSISSR